MRTKHKLSDSESPFFELIGPGDGVALLGRGRVRGRIEEGAVVLRVDGLTTQMSTYKKPIHDFLRKQLNVRPDYSSAYGVEILIETLPESPRCDVDNVAKALLDALTGRIFRDDSQVNRLLVERRVSERERIWLRAYPRQAENSR